MDPIHPILPQPVNIPPVMPSQGAGRISRDAPRDRRGDPPAQRAAAPRRREAELEGGDSGEDEGSLHVDITV